jgi:hypothetical protein
MKPKNVNEALDIVHARLMAAVADLEYYLRPPQSYSPDLEAIKDAVLDAHLLVTWIKDNK